MHISAPLSIATTKAVAPIIGNTNAGGACYDGNGQALYAVYDTDGFKVYRTRGGYQSLRDEDGSVDYLSTILTAQINAAPPTPAATLQRIGGTVYATVTGWFADGSAGTWIYRDTGAHGEGPWVLHGTVQALGGLKTTSDSWGMGPYSSEILVAGGLWCINAPYYTTFPNAQGGVYTSADGGATWTNRLSVGFYIGGVYGRGWSRNFADIGGTWYVGGYGEGGSGKHFKSSDLVTWTDIGDLATATDKGYTFPVADPDFIYRWDMYSQTLQAAAAAPETMPTWTSVAAISSIEAPSGFAYPILCNIAPDARLMLVAINAGLVLGIARRSGGLPPCRLYPRRDGLATSTAKRPTRFVDSRQGGFRQIGYC